MALAPAGYPADHPDAVTARRAMDKLRVGMERIWKGHADEPEFLRDNLQDLLKDTKTVFYDISRR